MSVGGTRPIGGIRTRTNTLRDRRSQSGPQLSGSRTGATVRARRGEDAVRRIGQVRGWITGTPAAEDADGLHVRGSRSWLGTGNVLLRSLSKRRKGDSHPFTTPEAVVDNKQKTRVV